jgi:putative redox protein
MKARVTWLEKRTFVGEAGSGHSVVLGTAAGPDGLKPGPSPMEMVLIGTGGCTAFDVVLILERSREPVEDCVVELDADRAEEDPQVFTRIHMRFIVKGPGLDRDKVERAIKLSAEKYCSASAMLAKTAEITRDFEIVDTAAG